MEDESLDAVLSKLEGWDFDKDGTVEEFFECVVSSWMYTRGDCRQIGSAWFLPTLGWSENAEILDAMWRNLEFRRVYTKADVTGGGGYIFLPRHLVTD